MNGINLHLRDSSVDCVVVHTEELQIESLPQCVWEAAGQPSIREVSGVECVQEEEGGRDGPLWKGRGEASAVLRGLWNHKVGGLWNERDTS